MCRETCAHAMQSILQSEHVACLSTVLGIYRSSGMQIWGYEHTNSLGNEGEYTVCGRDGSLAPSVRLQRVDNALDDGAHLELPKF